MVNQQLKMAINRHSKKENQPKTNNEPPSLTKFDVLALDVATLTGYYSAHGSGTWDFKESKRRNDNKQHKAFRDTLINFITEHGIKQVYAEDVNAGTHFGGMRKLSEFRGILLEVCDELNLPEPEFINISTIKKFATGNGKASKEDMVEACINKYHHTPVDDNEADACHIFYYYLKRHRIPWVTEEN